MIDINLYRENENIAKREVEKWQVSARHNIDNFEKTGFPVRVNNIAQLRQLLDTMSEGLFDSYMQEIEGLTKSELELLLNAIKNIIQFQYIYFPNNTPLIPFNNLMKALVLYTKLSKLEYQSVLEIGAGSGIFSFFMQQKKDLELYTQIEVCESFYLLQNHINSFLFQEKFEQKALISNSDNINFYIYKSDDVRETYEEVDLIKTSKPKKICSQFPWWNLGELANNSQNYDLVLSNANLLEFSNFALHDYLSLIKLKLSQQGLFIFHCEGDNVNNSFESLFDIMYKFNYAPLFIQASTLMVIKDIPSLVKSKKLLLAPVNASTKLLLETKEFTDKYDEIYILDDNKSHEHINGYPVISRDEVKKLNIKDALIVTRNKKITSMFKEHFLSIGINCIDFQESSFTKSFGIFVSEEHELFKKYHKRENFKTHFDSKEEHIYNFFDFDIDKKQTYSKQDIFELLKG